MQFIFDIINKNKDLFILYNSIFLVIGFIFLLFHNIRVSKINKKYKKLSKDIGGKNIEKIIHEYYDKIDKNDIRINTVENKIDKIENKILDCVQKIGMVRYDAFGDMGGEMSFSIALLDEKHNGIIISSMYGRNNSIVYGKPVKKGVSSFTLSAEELQALDRAKNNSLNEYNRMIS